MTLASSMQTPIGFGSAAVEQASVPGNNFAGGEVAGLGECIKALQKRSTLFKNAWAQFCQTQGGGRNDPLKHDSTFHISFFDALAASSNATASTGTEDHPAKRMRTDASTIPGAMAHTTEKIQFVSRLQAFQQTGPQQMELWTLYADTYLGGMRDPAGHDVAILKEFCDNHQVPDLGAVGTIGGMGAMAPGTAPGIGIGMPR